MSTVTTPSPSGSWLRGVMIVVAIVVVLIPILGLRQLLANDDPLDAAPIGAISLSSGNRLLYLVDDHVAVVPLGDGNGARSSTATVSEVQCTGVYAAGGTGVCLRKNNALTWSATVLDRNLQEIGSHAMEGQAALARVSPSGRMVAWTSLRSGTGFTGTFDAATTILDTKSGEPVDLDTFKHVGAPAGGEVWGVTFVDDNRFYASLMAGGVRYLVGGDLAKRRLTALAQDVTSPALSPDRHRIAYLRRTEGRWQLTVMDLTTKSTLALADRRSVVDQPGWLSKDAVVYTIRSADRTPSIWQIDRNGVGRPQLLIDKADSPSPL